MMSLTNSYTLTPRDHRLSETHQPCGCQSVRAHAWPPTRVRCQSLGFINWQCETEGQGMCHKLPAGPRDWATEPPGVARSSPGPTLHVDLSGLPSLSPFWPGPRGQSNPCRLHEISMRRGLGTSAQGLQVPPSSLCGHHTHSDLCPGQGPDICLAYCPRADRSWVWAHPIARCRNPPPTPGPSPTRPYFSSFPQLPTPTSSTLA